jgi:hypothetical protein
MFDLVAFLWQNLRTHFDFPGLCFDSWSVRLSSTGHFFSVIWFLKNQPYTRPSSWPPEKTPGCQERYWYSLRAAKQVRCPFFLLVWMHHTILEQFTLFKQSSSWDSCAGWPSSCKQKWDMDLSGHIHAPRLPCISAAFGCHTMLWVYQLETTVWAHSARTYHRGMNR